MGNSMSFLEEIEEHIEKYDNTRLQLKCISKRLVKIREKLDHDPAEGKRMLTILIDEIW